MKCKKVKWSGHCWWPGHESVTLTLLEGEAIEESGWEIVSGLPFCPKHKQLARERFAVWQAKQNGVAFRLAFTDPKCPTCGGGDLWMLPVSSLVACNDCGAIFDRSQVK